MNKTVLHLLRPGDYCPDRRLERLAALGLDVVGEHQPHPGGKGRHVQRFGRQVFIRQVIIRQVFIRQVFIRQVF